MRYLLILLISSQVFASDNFKLSEGRKVFVGPSIKLWCSLTEKGKAKVGGKKKLASGNLVVFPKTNGTGHLPSVVASDLSKAEEVNEFFKSIEGLCVEQVKALPKYVNEMLDSWKKEQIPMISLRTFDEVLWDFYDARYKKDKSTNACKIRKALNVKNSWVVTYQELNKGCL